MVVMFTVAISAVSIDVYLTDVLTNYTVPNLIYSNSPYALYIW